MRAQGRDILKRLEGPSLRLTAKQKKRVELMKKRATLRIGIPRILNMYTVNPIFSAYFESLGIPAENLIYSDYTNEQLYKEGAKRGAIDPSAPHRKWAFRTSTTCWRCTTRRSRSISSSAP